MKITLKLALCAAGTITACGGVNNEGKQPNIIYILADDLGYGDLSCYGQQKFSTPNIDKLASEGMLFTQHYSGCTVSAPSRSSLLTGQHTGHTPVRGNKSWKPEGNWPLKGEAVTIAEALKARGYTTGAFGKWGLGYIDTEGDPNAQGFDVFYGFNCQSLAHNYYPDHLWYNHEKVLLHENDSGKKGSYAPDLMHREALKFMKEAGDKPFFVYYPTIIPHAELFAKEEYMTRFRGKFDPEKPFSGIDSGPTFRLGPYGSQPEPHAAFAAMITQLDDYVGEILNFLEENGLKDNTVVFFTSDNGPHLEAGADPDYFNSNGELRGYKRDMYEGGIRTPLIVRWPGKIKPGTVSDHVSAFWDVLPTLSDITGAEKPSATDGISFLPALLGKKNQPRHEYLYWEFHEQGGKMAVRMSNWKAVKLNIDRNPDNPVELYDLSSDPGETKNIREANPDIVQKMENIMKEAHTESEDFPFAYEKNK